MDIESNHRYYIAYGSNLDIDQMHERLGDLEVIPSFKGYIRKHQLVFRGSREDGFFATIIPNTDCCVPVVLYKAVTGLEEILDRYEGISKEHYYKADFSLNVEDFKGNQVFTEGFAYIMSKRYNKGIDLPKPMYIKKLIKGYRYYGFDEEYIKQSIFETGNDLTIFQQAERMLQLEVVEGQTMH